MNGEPTRSRRLPHHERHRSELLAAIAAESAPGQARGRSARAPERFFARRLHPLAKTERPGLRNWLAPLMVTVAVLAVIALGVGGHALLRRAGQPSQPSRPGHSGQPGHSGTPPTATAARSSAGAAPSASAVGGGEWSVTENYTVTGPVSSLIVNDTAGSVSVTGGSGGEVSVTAKIYYRTSRPSISAAVSGRTLALGYSACTDCGVGFAVTVPRGTSVTVNEHTGMVTLDNLAGDVSVSDDTGMVALDNLVGDVSVRNGNGAINGTGLSAARASFRDGNGIIQVAFTTPPLQLSAVSDTGRVSVRVPSGTTYRVNASTQVGIVDDSVPQSPTATHVITATSDSGVVSVTAG